MIELFEVQYGSHLYGTNTPTSDLDKKVVYLPVLQDVLLGHKLQVFKSRVDAHGNKVSDTEQMPDNGVEIEYVPWQTFCRDFLNGQTYALECAFAFLQSDVNSKNPTNLFVRELVSKFLTGNVSSMAGFAKKQTFDYVHRGVRLQKARDLQEALQKLIKQHQDTQGILWLNTYVQGRKVMHALAEDLDLQMGTSENNGRVMETLLLNGREYLETTTVQHLLGVITKLVDSYGHRSQTAADTEVDRKSLMHAVRVYEQSLELLRIGRIDFPRENAQFLLSVKTDMDLEVVKKYLLDLEQMVEDESQETHLQFKTPELYQRFEEWLLGTLKFMYGLDQ